MPKPYSSDLRVKIVHCYHSSDYTQAEVADLFQVAESTVRNFLRWERERGSPAARPPGGGRPPALPATAHPLVEGCLARQNDLTLAELQAQLEAAGQPQVSQSTLSRLLQKLGWDRKKKSLHASERDTERVQEKRQEHWQELAGVSANRLKFIDEAGVNLALARLFGRAPEGQRAVGSVPAARGQNVSLLGCLGHEGLEALMSYEGAVDSVVFHTFIEKMVCPTLQAGDIVYLDNASIHQGAGVAELVAACGAELRYLPPYSPDLSPIENCWSKVKSILRDLAARSAEELQRALARAWDKIQPEDAAGWYAHCGYALN